MTVALTTVVVNTEFRARIVYIIPSIYIAYILHEKNRYKLNETFCNNLYLFIGDEEKKYIYG